MRTRLFFSSPEPVRHRQTIFPIFLPFSGCPQRCVFCAQDVQTGTARSSVQQALERAEAGLEACIREKGADFPPGAMEVAFFGGTFTALPEEDFRICLQFAEKWRNKGFGLRCSTRPDALPPGLLSDLGNAGFNCVELGIQSFSHTALAASQRGYTGETARHACRMVKEAGLRLGIQLLPGMPGHSLEAAFADLGESMALKPDCVRLYPCLVLRGTALEGLWRAGMYTPWELEPTVDFLARACREFQRAEVPIIRMGLAEEPGLAAHVLAGPRHPSIGSMARGRALYAYIRERLDALNLDLPDNNARNMLLLVPRRHQGEFWGQGGELVQAYARIGFARDRVRWRDGDDFAVEYEDGSPGAPAGGRADVQEV